MTAVGLASVSLNLENIPSSIAFLKSLSEKKLFHFFLFFIKYYLIFTHFSITNKSGSLSLFSQ